MKKMYKNKQNKLDYRDRFKIIKKLRVYLEKPTQIAKRYGVSRQTIYDVQKRFKKEGLIGLQDHLPGPLEKTINPKFYELVVQKRRTNDYGAVRLKAFFKKEGFFVSTYQIHKIIKKESILRNKMGKQSKPKYVRYQAEKCNDLWHTDWSHDPHSGKKLLVYQDDRSRFIVFAGLFDEAIAENSAIGLQKAIAKYGVPKEVVSDNGSHFKKPHSKRVVVSPLKEVEEKYGIHHIFIRPYHPQSNGKIERMFGSYKMEFPRMQHPDVHDCLSWMQYHNVERLHQSLDYETPAEIYLKRKANIV
jgi:transposase InsO family protein